MKLLKVLVGIGMQYGKISLIHMAMEPHLLMKS